MMSLKNSVLIPLAVGALVVVSSACGGDEEAAAADVPTTAPDVTLDAVGEPADEADEQGGDDDHADDEEHDEHDDEEHDDEEHDEHDDVEHDEHDDDEHDEHDDDEHDDEHDEHDEHDDEGSSGLGAHEHGTAEMTIAWFDDEVAIDLISPTFNVFGFEYEPVSDEDLAIEADRLTALTASGVIALNNEAGCSLAGPVATEVDRDGSHSEITVSWVFECENADDVSQVDAAGLFAEFPNFEDVDVQWVSESEQSAAELSPSATSFMLLQ
jgi:hypothetical protein